MESSPQLVSKITQKCFGFALCYAIIKKILPAFFSTSQMENQNQSHFPPYGPCTITCINFYFEFALHGSLCFSMFAVIISCDGLNMNEYDCLEASFLDLKSFCS